MPKWISVLRSWLLADVEIRFKSLWKHQGEGNVYCVILGIEISKYDAYQKYRGLFVHFTILNFDIEISIYKAITYTDMFFGFDKLEKEFFYTGKKQETPNAIFMKLDGEKELPRPEGVALNQFDKDNDSPLRTEALVKHMEPLE